MPDDEPRCPECGAKVRVFQRFCGSCGESMTWEVGEGQEPPKCPQCSTPVEVYQEKCHNCGQVMNWEAPEMGKTLTSKPVDGGAVQRDTQQAVQQKTPARRKGSLAKGIGIILIFIFAAIIISWLYPLLSPPMATVRVAVFNDCTFDVVDVAVYVDGVLEKHVPIYNGFWADFGTYSVPIDAIISVETTPESSSMMAKDFTVYGDEDIALIVDNSYLGTSSYPDLTVEPLPAPFSPESPLTEIPSIYVQVDYERYDWHTTNIGAVDHLVYGFSLDPWVDGHLTLELLDGNDRIVKTVSREFTSHDIQVDTFTHSYIVYVQGDPLDVQSFVATYQLPGGTTISDSGYITGPY